jgi:biopolymer transport protein ExbD
MAGSSDSADNPVAINIVPMIDVIFCLCLFFMCSFKFKQLEGKIESWLPKDKGVFSDAVSNPVLEEIRVVMRWDRQANLTRLSVNNRVVRTEDQLTSALKENLADYDKLGKKDVPGIIDAFPDVPWQNIITVMDIMKNVNIVKIEFAAPMPEESGGH